MILWVSSKMMRCFKTIPIIPRYQLQSNWQLLFSGLVIMEMQASTMKGCGWAEVGIFNSSRCDQLGCLAAPLGTVSEISSTMVIWWGKGSCKSLGWRSLLSSLARWLAYGRWNSGLTFYVRPAFFGNTWFDRKSNYSMNVQVSQMLPLHFISHLSLALDYFYSRPSDYWLWSWSTWKSAWCDSLGRDPNSTWTWVASQAKWVGLGWLCLPFEELVSSSI